MLNETALDYMPKLQFIKTHSEAQLPKKNHPTDAGFDVFAVESVTIPARGSAIAPIGLKAGCIPEGYFLRVEGRSGLGFKNGIQPHPGIIDSGYTGDCGIKLYNFTDVDYIIPAGKAVAQLIVYFNIDIEAEFTDKLVSSVRGEKGFGSSDK